MKTTLPFLLACLVLAAGCSPKSVPPPKDVTPNWSWDRYPAVERMRLATLPCRVLPKTSLTVIAPISGQLRLYIRSAETNLPAGFVWAEFEPKALSAEASELEEARKRIEERERMFAEIELPKEKLKLDRDIAAAKRHILLLELLSTNRDLAGLVVNTVGLSQEGVLKPGTLQQAKQELALLEQNRTYLCASNSAGLGFDLESARMEWEHRQADFERRKNQTQLKLPFAGQLIVSLQMADGVTDYPVAAGQELAMVRDLSSILLRVPLEDAAWMALPTDRLTAVLSLPDGTRLEAPFLRKKLERVSLREQMFYYFKFPAEESAQAGHLAGTDLTCELWIGLGQPARIVPKLALVLHEPAAFQNRQWGEGLAQILPGAQVLVEGQTDLAILPPVAEQKPNAKGVQAARARGW